ncbi:hypothetical protein C2E23DRAFT_174734 [Lenzites betulinus]|nr:hypothetical protein C2E23DRAFT_174734 [Lenzites betulinus]
MRGQQTGSGRSLCYPATPRAGVHARFCRVACAVPVKSPVTRFSTAHTVPCARLRTTGWRGAVSLGSYVCRPEARSALAPLGMSYDHLSLWTLTRNPADCDTDASFHSSRPSRCGSHCRRPAPCPVLVSSSRPLPHHHPPFPTAPDSNPPPRALLQLSNVFSAILSVTWKRPRLECDHTNALLVSSLGAAGYAALDLSLGMEPHGGLPALLVTQATSFFSLPAVHYTLRSHRTRSYTRHSDYPWRNSL